MTQGVSVLQKAALPGRFFVLNNVYEALLYPVYEACMTTVCY